MNLKKDNYSLIAMGEEKVMPLAIQWHINKLLSLQASHDSVLLSNLNSV